MIERLFVMIVTALQLMFFLASYLATPRDVHWHIRTSWPRLTEQLALPLAFVMVLTLSANLFSWNGGEERRSSV